MKHCLLGLLLAAGFDAGAHVVTDHLDGPDSLYTARLIRVLEHWPALRPSHGAVGPLTLSCIGTPSDDAYVGIVRHTTIQAAIAKVEEVLDDIAHYKDLFPSTVSVRVLPGTRQGNRFATAWEQRVPVFFLPNVTYELSNSVDKTTTGFSVYRYKLRRSDTLVASDGLVVLEAVGSEATRITEYGFFVARPSPVPASLIWRESLRAAFLSSAAIKLRAENPSWTYARVAEEANLLMTLDPGRFDTCLAGRPGTELRDGIQPRP